MDSLISGAGEHGNFLVRTNGDVTAIDGCLVGELGRYLCFREFTPASTGNDTHGMVPTRLEIHPEVSHISTVLSSIFISKGSDPTVQNRVSSFFLIIHETYSF